MARKLKEKIESDNLIKKKNKLAERIAELIASFYLEVGECNIKIDVDIDFEQISSHKRKLSSVDVDIRVTV